MKCDMNCLNCEFPDCINDEITPEEIEESEKRDLKIHLPWNKRNPERCKELYRLHYIANKERIKKRMKDYYQANKERLSEKARERYRTNKVN